MKISVVIPVYKGSKTIGPLVKDIFGELSAHDVEIVLVNDGSPDNSESVCEAIAAANKAVRFISLRRNFGENNAVMCGLAHSTGEYVAVVDDDFQNPPSEIIKLVTECAKGYDVVYSRYPVKNHHWFRNVGSRFNDWGATFLLNKPRALYLSTFRAIRREVVDEIVKYKGPFPYIDGLILRVTNNFGSVEVRHDARQEGTSNYTLAKLVGIYLNMFLNFSIKPIRVFTLIGTLVFIFGSLMSAYVIFYKILHPDNVLGWTSLMVTVLTFSGFQIMFLGLLGEYLGKQYLDQNATPQWVARKKVNVDRHA